MWPMRAGNRRQGGRKRARAAQMCPRRHRHRWAVPRAGGRVPGLFEGGNGLRGCFAMFYVTQTTSLTDFEFPQNPHLLAPAVSALCSPMADSR